MGRNTMILLGGVLALVAFVLLSIWFGRWVRSTSLGSMMREVMPDWAAQGPFSNGTESALAMRFAWCAVFGEVEEGKVSDQIDLHARAFDANAQKWEALQRDLLAKPTAMFGAHIAEVRRLRAAVAYRPQALELVRDGTLTLFDLRIPFTVDDVNRAHQQKKEALTANALEVERERLEDRYRRARLVAQLDAAAEATGDVR